MALNSSCDDEKKIRRLRKKLRQIENLEFCNRILNDEETFKVSLKGSIRKELNELLTILEQEKKDESDTEDGFTIVQADHIAEEEMKDEGKDEKDPKALKIEEAMDKIEEAMMIDEVAKKDKSIIDTTAVKKKFDGDEVQEYFEKI